MRVWISRLASHRFLQIFDIDWTDQNVLCTLRKPINPPDRWLSHFLSHVFALLDTFAFIGAFSTPASRLAVSYRRSKCILISRGVNRCLTVLKPRPLCDFSCRSLSSGWVTAHIIVYFTSHCLLLAFLEPCFQKMYGFRHRLHVV